MPLARRLLSLTGIVPLGAFLLVHLFVQARAIRGEAAFDSTLGALGRLPALTVLEAVFIYAPLLVHGAIGLWLLAARAPIAEPSPYPRAVGIAVRATGVASLVFLVLHVPELRLRVGGDAASGSMLLTLMAADLSSTWHGLPWRALGYLLGTAAVTFHFAAGLWAAFARSPRGAAAATRRKTGWAAVVLGGAMWLLFVDVVVLHATGTRLIGSPAADPATTAPCPVPSSTP